MRPFETPTAAQFGQLRAWLATQGMTPAQVANGIGNAPQGRAIGTIGDTLRAQLKTLPKRTTVQVRG